MPIFWVLYGSWYTYVTLESRTKYRADLEKEKGVRGVKGIRDTLREIDEKISENKNKFLKKPDKDQKTK